jgi:hypothetical protein
MADEILMNHPDGSGRLIPHALYATLKPKYEARHAAFEGYFGTPEEREAAREAIGAASMAQDPVYKVEAAETVPVQPRVVPVSLFGGLPTKG